MPSDPRVLQALDILRGSIDRFRSSVGATLEEVRGVLTTSRSGSEGRVEQLRRQFGPFAGSRVDLSRLATVLDVGRGLDLHSQQRLEAAYDTLQDVAARGPELFCVEVPSGTGVGLAVSAQLAAIGRVFGAARIAAATRGVATVLGMSDEHALARFPFSEWNAAERRLAPPLVVITAGRDLNVGTLSRFLDGSVKIVLIVDGPCAPVPLVRLISPNVLVMQAFEVEELQPLSTWTGTAICAVMPPTSAAFVHDPAGGAELWQRLTVRESRDGRLARIGGLSPAQQEEEINQLTALATRPAPAVPLLADDSSSRAIAPADRLAEWLLRQGQFAETE